MAYRLVALDIDGTLLDPRGNVSPAVRAAIHRARDAGLVVCLATGRNYAESRKVLDDLDHRPAAVFVTGAVIVDTLADKTMHRFPMGKALATELCTELEKLGHSVLALQDFPGRDYWVSERGELTDATRWWLEHHPTQVEFVSNLANRDHTHTVRIGIDAEPHRIGAADELLRTRFAGRVAFHRIHVPISGIDVMEIFEPKVSKWAGLNHIADMHGIDPAHIVAVGDDVNDLSMIRGAGLGVAMGNAKAEVKAAAHKTIGTNKEDGLARFLDELVDGKHDATLERTNGGPRRAPA